MTPTNAALAVVGSTDARAPLNAGRRVRPQAGLKVETLADLLAAKFKPREHLLSPWLREGESALVWSAPGTGKTWLTLTLALMVAGGGKALGWRGGTPRKVLVIDGEMHGEDLTDRMRALLNGIEGINRAAAAENLMVLARQRQGGDVRFPDIAERDLPPTPGGAALRRPGQDVVFDEVMECGAQLVILDNYATLAEVADENDAAAMTPVLSFLLRLKQAGIAVILVHHSGKSGTSYRGSSKLATSFEVILGLTPSEAAGLAEGAAFRLDWTKFRGERSEAVRSRDVRLSKRPDGSPEWIAEASAQDDITALLAELKSCRHGSQRGLAAALGWDPAKVTRTKKRAIAEQHITDAAWETYLSGDSPSQDF